MKEIKIGVVANRVREHYSIFQELEEFLAGQKVQVIRARRWGRACNQLAQRADRLALRGAGRIGGRGMFKQRLHRGDVPAGDVYHIVAIEPHNGGADAGPPDAPDMHGILYATGPRMRSGYSSSGVRWPAIPA